MPESTPTPQPRPHPRETAQQHYNTWKAANPQFASHPEVLQMVAKFMGAIWGSVVTP